MRTSIDEYTMLLLLCVQTLLLLEEDKAAPELSETARTTRPTTKPRMQYAMMKPRMAPPTAHAAQVM